MYTKGLPCLSIVQRPNVCTIESVRNDATYLIRNGKYTSPRELEWSFHRLYERKVYGKSQVLVIPKTLLLSEGVGSDEVKITIRFFNRSILPEIERPLSQFLSKLWNRKIEVPSSAFVRGQNIPSLDWPVYKSISLIQRKKIGSPSEPYRLTVFTDIRVSGFIP